MQHRYVGDIGDFGKYGLLRALSMPEEGERLSLGVVWYLTPDGNGRDGRQTAYLDRTTRTGRQLSACDPELYLELDRLVGEGRRNVPEIEASGILPPDTRYHDGPLNIRRARRQRGRRIAEVRAEAREEWNRAALETTRGCDLVFLDPDNGLGTGEMKPGSLHADKYAFLEELGEYLSRGQSLVVYHHLNRSERADRQVHRRQREIFERLTRRAFAMRFHRGSPRVFLVIPGRRNRQELAERAREMTRGPWGRHFSMIG